MLDHVGGTRGWFRGTALLWVARCLLAVACSPIVLLTGCPGDPPAAAAPGRTPAQLTAPPIHATNLARAAQSAPALPATSSAAPANAAKAQQLIGNAERSYRSGVANYQAGRLEAARIDFDFAVDILLTSGMDMKAESPLAEELERLLNAVNALELAALKQGNGFSPRTEESPLDVANDLTFAPNPELAAKLKTELNVTSDLPLVINDEVAGYIGVFSTSESFRKHMAASLQRVGKYRGLIQRVLKEEGVPQDLIYLAVAESGFQPQVVNTKSGAGGMWQFMTYTGPQFGLIRNGYFDYRFDPEKSSRAYARYIKALYNQFGDWYLAMAAYDWGPGNIQKAVSRTGYADYWELYRRNAMPGETRAYVPKILAAVIMAKNPERYGLNKLVPSPAVIYDTVSIDYAVDLNLVADVTGSTVTELVALNPALLRLSTPRDIAFDLHIPPGSKDLYTERMKDIPEDKRSSWRFHVVKAGETLETIAAAMHSHAGEIAESNEIGIGAPLAAGDELIIPMAGAASTVHPQRYNVRRGDSLVTIADRFNVSVEDLRRWNSLSSNAARPGRVLYVAEPLRLGPSARRGRAARRIAGRAARGAKTASRGSLSRSSGRAAHGASSASHGRLSSAAKGHAKSSSTKSKHVSRK